jgi:hypothetical protein
MARQPRKPATAPEATATHAATNAATEGKSNMTATAPAHAHKVKETTAPKGDASKADKPAKPEPKPFTSLSFAELNDNAEARNALNVKQLGVATATIKGNTALAAAFDGADSVNIGVAKIVDADKKQSFVACVTCKGKAFWSWNDAKGSNTYGTQQGAIGNALQRIEGVKSDQYADIAPHAFAPLNEDGSVQIPLWEQSAKLVDAGQHAATIVADLINGNKKTRLDYIALGSVLHDAFEVCRKLSTTGNVNNAQWGEYKSRFFPAIDKLGKNTASEAIQLGRAPASVLEAWPENQSSAKSFVAWLSTVRGRVGNATVALIKARNLDALQAWNNYDATEAGEGDIAPSKPAAITTEELRAVLANDVIAELTVARDKAEDAVASKIYRDAKGNNAAKTAEMQLADLNNAEDRAAELAVAVYWLPELLAKDAEAFSKDKNVLAMQQSLADLWNEYPGREQAEAAKEAETAKATAETAATAKRLFKDMSEDEATAFILAMLIEREDGQEIADRLAVELPEAIARDDAATEATVSDAAADADKDIDGV